MSTGGSLEVRVTGRVIYVPFEDGSKAFLRYKIEDGKIYLIETYTPPQHRGKGVARRMVEKAIEIARERRLEVVPLCSYAVYYFLKNREARKLLAEPYRSMSDEDLKRYYEERLAAERAKNAG